MQNEGPLSRFTMSSLALEANPRVFERFRDEIQAQGVDYMHFAAAAESGNVNLHIPEVIAGNARPHVNRMASLNQIRVKNSTMVKASVPAIALDQLLSPASPERLCMWIDVEGAMDKVLEGAQRTLERTDLIYCEIEERQVWKDQMLASAILTKLEMSGFVMVARDFQTPVQFNPLLVRAELADSQSLLERVEAYSAAAEEAVRALISS